MNNIHSASGVSALYKNNKLHSIQLQYKSRFTLSTESFIKIVFQFNRITNKNKY
jgi:hypothetical protein